MTDDDILDHWRAAERAYVVASHDERPEAMFAKMAAEQAAIERFGMDLYLRAYHDRFGEPPRA